MDFFEVEGHPETLPHFLALLLGLGGDEGARDPEGVETAGAGGVLGLGAGKAVLHIGPDCGVVGRPQTARDFLHVESRSFH